MWALLLFQHKFTDYLRLSLASKAFKTIEVDNNNMASSKKNGSMKSSRAPSCRGGLHEALWACVLDDYVDEDEEKAFSMIIGEQQQQTACLTFPRSKTVADPRSVAARGGPSDGSYDGIVRRLDGTPGIYSDSVTNEEPPFMWLALPPKTEDIDWSELPDDWQDRLDNFEQKDKRGRSRSIQVSNTLSMSRASSRGASRAGSMARSQSIQSKKKSRSKSQGRTRYNSPRKGNQSNTKEDRQQSSSRRVEKPVKREASRLISPNAVSEDWDPPRSIDPQEKSIKSAKSFKSFRSFRSSSRKGAATARATQGRDQAEYNQRRSKGFTVSRAFGSP
jgi:hypothetical protein